MQNKGFKTLLCAAAMMAPLPAASVAGEEAPVRLFSEELAAAIVAQDEYQRIFGNDHFNSMYITRNYTTYDIYFVRGTYRIEDYAPRFAPKKNAPRTMPEGCVNGLPPCFYVRILFDMKVIESDWTHDKTDDEIFGSGMVLPF